MRPSVKKKILIVAAASTGLLGFVGYPALKSVYPIRKHTTVVDDYVDLPTATADLTKDISLPESVGAGNSIPVTMSNRALLSMLKSSRPSRRERAIDELARQRKLNDGECLEIAQALRKQDIIRLARTLDADIRLFLPPPSMKFIEKTLESSRVEKLVKTILKDISDEADSCSGCTNFYTNLSIRMRPDSEVFAMNDLNQVDKAIRVESRKRKKSAYNEDIIRLKAILNNVICGEKQALSMVKSGLPLVLLYFHHKYKEEVRINALLSQILANLTVNQSTRDYIFVDGWIRTLTQYTRSEHLDISLPAIKALSNLDEDQIKLNGIYGNHIYLLSPAHRNHEDPQFDIVFVHGLIGSVFKSWCQGTVSLDEHPIERTPTTELLPGENFQDEQNPAMGMDQNHSDNKRVGCWPKDWLPQDVHGLRVLAVDYPTALSNWRTDCDLNKDTLKERAKHVMRQLENAKLGSRPIIWVAHSMGGLLVKQILVLCEGNDQSDNAAASPFKQNLLKMSKGVVFYSVPHKGSNLGWIERKNLQKLLMLTTEVIELQKDSPMLNELHESFLAMINRKEEEIQFITFAERSISKFGVNKVVQWKGILVHEDSLAFELGPNYQIDIDHAHTCKPHNKNALTYVKTKEFIKDLMQSANSRQQEKLSPYIWFLP